MIYAFENCLLDTERRELRRDNDLVSIEPGVFDLLQYLICNRERVVSKDDLIATVWKGRIVSESTLTGRINAARCAIGDTGQQRRLLRTLPRKGFRFVGEVREEHQLLSDGSTGGLAPPTNEIVAQAASPPLPERPSIAVLPFTNLSGPPEQEYFADGIVDDIITALAHFRWLFVIARNSSFAYKGRAVDVRQVGRELGVRYVLEGSVRKRGSRARIIAQLIDATNGVHISADRFDGDIRDIFALQEQVAASVAGVIAPRLERAEMERMRRRPTENLDAYGYFMRASAKIRENTREANSEAQRLLYKAIELDPHFSSAYALATFCHCFRKSFGPYDWWVANQAQEIAETAKLARRTVELGRDNPFALSFAGFSLAYLLRELDDGAALLDRALELNPNFALAWNLSGWVRIWLGEPEMAIEHLAQAMRLSPLDPSLYGMQTATARAHYCAASYVEAASWAERALREQPNNVDAIGLVAASKAMLGQIEEAQRAMARLRALAPDRRISVLRNVQPPFRRQEDAMTMIEGLRKAGLPE